MFERLPTPWGLVRLGVAPDHPKLKTVSRAFEKIADRPGFRFLGNVEVGRDIEHADLMRLYDAVIYAVGAQTDRRLGIPGEDLPGSWPATEFVAWYNGHPDHHAHEFDLDVERAVVIGVGNVALDVARMLALTPEELAPTDTSDRAIAAINASPVREIVVVGRRGPAQAAFTTPELTELGELAGADVDRRRGRSRGRRRHGHEFRTQHRGAARVRRARAVRQAQARRTEVLPLPGRDPRRRPRREHRAGQERARCRQPCRADGRARDALVRDRLPQRRLPRRLASRAFPSTRRRGRSRTRAAASSRASTPPAGSSAARPA